MSATMSVSSSQQQNTTNGASNGAIDSQVQVIVNDFMCAQLALKGYQWVPHNEDNLGSIEMDSHRRSRIGESLASLGDEYLRQYNVDFSQMCDRLGLDPNNALSTFTSVANELFVEGIKWNHIVTFLVFGTEFAFYSARNGFPQIVHEVSHWLASYTTNHLLSWINDHGGWVRIDSNIIHFYNN